SLVYRSRWQIFCFFFQAEDGIRDLTVTGVQTCALPILLDASGEAERKATREALREAARAVDRVRGRKVTDPEEALAIWRVLAERSEERRVGKECRSRRWPEH